MPDEANRALEKRPTLSNPNRMNEALRSLACVAQRRPDTDRRVSIPSPRDPTPATPQSLADAVLVSGRGAVRRVVELVPSSPLSTQGRQRNSELQLQEHMQNQLQAQLHANQEQVCHAGLEPLTTPDGLASLGICQSGVRGLLVWGSRPL